MHKVSSGQAARLDALPVDASTRPSRPSLARLSSLVLLAFVGTWLGHTLEYLRTRGPARLGREMSSSVHLYMVPLGLVLLALLALGGMIWVRAAKALAQRLDWLRDALRRGRPVDLDMRPRPGGLPTLPSRFGSLWMLLGGAQLLLYVIQENVEAHLAGHHAPGIRVLLGQHWGASPLHLVVAGLLAGATTVAVRRRRHLVRDVEFHEQLLACLWERRTASATLPVAAAPRSLTPLERWGSQRWARPPPPLLAA